MQNQTLIFIPDISGFTEFVNQTAIEHSQHIISELLEVIIDANQLELTISEIEGDAVLFYKNDYIPEFKDIIAQSKEMFLRFHSYLNEIDKTNVCQCGACKTASNLTLKFITHLGDTKEVVVKNFKKLIGSDLILAHRLLKNKIISDEYLLITDKYLDNFSTNISQFENWVKVESAIEEIDKFGSVSSKYIDFNPLRKTVSDFIDNNKPAEYSRKPDILININAPILIVHHALTDPKTKYKYVKGIKNIIADKKINRVYSSHTCVFNNLEIHFVTKSNNVDNNKIIYTEEASLKNGFSFITDYRIREVNGITELSIYIIKSVKSDSTSAFKKIKDLIFLKFIIFNNKKGMKSFKNYCERISK
jgi:hypothetical protein